MPDAKTKIDILGTFVVQPLVDTLENWAEHFQHDCSFTSLEYGQLFQHLLQSKSGTSEADFHILVFAVRDLLPESQLTDQSDGTIHPNIKEFIDAVRSGVSGSAGNWFVVRCPDPNHGSPGHRQQYDSQADHITNAFNHNSRVLQIDASDLSAMYDVDVCFDEISDKHGHIPYTESYYSAIGAAVYRYIRGYLGSTYKLIVTDCDGTLWEGVCGEIGAEEISLDPEHIWLQQFLKNKKEAGMLLAICSHNDSEDVEKVFSQRKDFVLTYDDFTKTRIDWHPKKHSVRQIAEELGIALSSVIFLDNDPVQRDQLRTSLPQTLVPELPADSSQWPNYLGHVWAFDVPTNTAESNRRHSYYRNHAAREEVRANSESYSQFLKKLQLNISINQATEVDVPRIFELVNRVTQFNINATRYSESEIRAMISSNNEGWIVTHVKDRFGDYGLVGALAFKLESVACRVSAFLLSCRALGRGVENRMIQTLGELCQKHGAATLKFDVAKTTRNYPGLAYLKYLGMGTSDVHLGEYEIASQVATEKSNTDWDWQENIDLHQSNKVHDPSPSVSYSQDPDSVSENSLILSAAEILSRSDSSVTLSGSQIPFTANCDTEMRILKIFHELLGKEDIDIDEEFFEAGGHSLLVIRLLSRIKRDFNVDLPIRMLFMERLTVSNLASIVKNCATLEQNSAELESIKNALDSFSDKELESLFGNIGQPAGDKV